MSLDFHGSMQTLGKLAEAIWQMDAMAKTYERTTDMIEVGKVVTRRSVSYPSYGLGPRDPEHFDAEWVTVSVGIQGVRLTSGSADGRYPTIEIGNTEGGILITDPDKVIEVAQMMMKAAESQAEYAKAIKDLSDEKIQLDKTFKDRISGLGIDDIEEPGRPSLKSVPVDDYNGIIVEAG